MLGLSSLGPSLQRLDLSLQKPPDNAAGAGVGGMGGGPRGAVHPATWAAPGVVEAAAAALLTVRVTAGRTVLCRHAWRRRFCSCLRSRGASPVCGVKPVTL